MINQAALGAIKCYKKFISPFKGWRCAYGSVHGISCSTVVENLIKEHGVIAAQPHIKNQFRQCRATYDELARTDSSGCSDGAGCDGCYIPALPCGGRSRGGIDGCDVFDCDIGPC